MTDNEEGTAKTDVRRDCCGWENCDIILRIDICFRRKGKKGR